MINEEPIISVGILEHTKEVRGIFNGYFEMPNSVRLGGAFKVLNDSGKLILYDDQDIEVMRAEDIYCHSLNASTFTLNNVAIGINFHWERKENQTFEGDLYLRTNADGAITAINKIGAEKYLKSVISSEMSAEAPIELLKAHAITSRSWLAAMLERKKKFKNIDMPSKHSQETEHEIIRWYDLEDHLLYDVCADDHCQRYQGITKVISKSVEEAIIATRGVFLVNGEEICDARFSKACGGRTELFENTWENTPMSFLKSISDSIISYPPVFDEKDAENWMLSSPDAYCNTNDGRILKQVLPSFDQETTDFFRWKVIYTREQLEEILYERSGIDFGTLMDIVPLKRGPSGRVYKLKIVGDKRTIVVGKELEIRKWLSKSHLYSSAFIVRKDYDENNIPKNFTFYGAGWGHGVGLCQIGAAVMAMKGFKSEEIVRHYFHDSELKKLY